MTESTQKNTTETRYYIQDDESVTEAVVRAVSSETGFGQTELTPLYSIVDTDALNRLFTPLKDGDTHVSDSSVTFSYGGQQVRVTGAGVLKLVEATPE